MNRDQERAMFAKMGKSNPYLGVSGAQSISKLNTKSDAYEKWLVQHSNNEWIPLDPRFPNIKGVIPEEIDKFVYEFADDIEFNEKNKAKYEKMLRLTSINHPKQARKLDLYNILYYIEYWKKEGKTVDGDTIYEAFMGKAYPDYEQYYLAKQKLLDEDGNFRKEGEEELKNEYIKLQQWNKKVDKKIRKIEPKKIEEKQTPEYRINYINHCKTFDRKEITEDCKKMGKKVLKRLSELEEWDVEDFNNVSDSTIIVTSPRGGHELMSIFAYANKISDKQMIPNDIFQEVGYYDLVGFDINDKTKNKLLLKTDNREEVKTGAMALAQTLTIRDIKNIVFIDDISSSGTQYNIALRQLNEMMRYSNHKVNIIPVFLCGNEKNAKQFAEYAKQHCNDMQHEMPYNINVTDPIIGNKMMNEIEYDVVCATKKFTKDTYVSVAFPWSIPDGIQDFMLRQLYKPELRKVKPEEINNFVMKDRDQGGL